LQGCFEHNAIDIVPACSQASETVTLDKGVSNQHLCLFSSQTVCLLDMGAAVSLKIPFMNDHSIDSETNEKDEEEERLQQQQQMTSMLKLSSRRVLSNDKEKELFCINPKFCKVPTLRRYPFLEYCLTNLTTRENNLPLLRKNHLKNSSINNNTNDPSGGVPSDPTTISASEAYILLNSSNKLYSIREVYVNQLSLLQYNDLKYELNLLSQCSYHPNILHLYALYEPSLLNVNLYIVTEYIGGKDILTTLAALSPSPLVTRPGSGGGSSSAAVSPSRSVPPPAASSGSGRASFRRGGGGGSAHTASAAAASSEDSSTTNHYGYTLNDLRYYFQQIASALEFLHKHGCTYHNLLPENIIFTHAYHPSSSSFRNQGNMIKLIGFEYLDCYKSSFLEKPRRQMKKDWNDPHFFPPLDPEEKGGGGGGNTAKGSGGAAGGVNSQFQSQRGAFTGQTAMIGGGISSKKGSARVSTYSSTVNERRNGLGIVYSEKDGGFINLEQIVQKQELQFNSSKNFDIWLFFELFYLFLSGSFPYSLHAFSTPPSSSSSSSSKDALGLLSKNVKSNAPLINIHNVSF
jgi:serine/threonine protein kinase